MVRGSIAYFGTYAVLDDGSGLSIDIAGSTLPNWTGTRQIRKVSMPAADRLVLTNPVASGGGVAEVAWERL